MKIVFAGTPFFAAEMLSCLIETHFSVIAVLTQKDRPKGRGQHIEISEVKALSLKYNIPVFQPIRLKDPEIEKTLSDLKPDLMIVVAYGLIIPQQILNIPRYGCINVHASILPRFRGASPIQHAILAGDKITGITTMQMDAGLDTGDILKINTCNIDENETSQSLLYKLIPIAKQTLLETLQDLENHAKKNTAINTIKQDNSKANYAPKILKQEAKINWHETSDIIERKIRAFIPWPVAFTEMDGILIRIYDAKKMDKNESELPGTIINANETGIDVATQDGVLRLLEIQLPGKKVLSVKDIMHSKKDVFLKGKKFN